MELVLVISFSIIMLLSFALWQLNARAQRERARARREHQQELNLVNARLNALMSSVAEGVILIDATGRVLYLNDAAKAFLRVEDAVGADLERLTWGWQIGSLAQAVIARQADSLAQLVVKDERAFQVTVRANDEGGAVIVVSNVTELQRLGRIRRDFVANISHELRTPVTTLQLVTETLANALRDNLAAAPDLLTKLRGQIELLNQLTEEAMDLALIESGQMPLKLVEAHLAGLLNQVLDLLRPQAEQKQIAIDAQISSDLIVLADSAGAQKVLRNLLHNAIKFTPSGGRISVRARRDADNIEIQVSDTGIGIPAKDLPRIFERFYKADRARAQGEARGTGLGLAIAKHIVEGHGGRIWAESVEGRGSTFHFTLPAAS